MPGVPMESPIASPKALCSPRGPGSPRPLLKPHETVPELGGKAWHVGDPHSRYRFIRVLGTGHYGVTYLCSSLLTGELVAIKALDKLHPEYQREAAIEEIRILAAVCDHPNVVDVHEVWEDASYIFIAMEACLGGELFDVVIERKHFSEADAASITAAVLSVIQHCHAKGIIHRDLKPENFLLLRPDELSADNLRAIDFGLSKFVGRGEMCRACVGSSYYVAPEVLRGAYSQEADAWSVGTITYILLSGFPPFWGSSDQAIFHRILNKPVDFDYQPWHQISAAAKDFVQRLLHKDPVRRMTVAEGLTHPWITDQATDVPLSTDIIGRLEAFTHQNRLKCLLMTVAAHHLSHEEIGGLRKIFHFIDADADGEISMHDLSVALQQAGLEWEEQGIVRLLAGLDLAHDGTVHVEEFIAAALDQRKVLSAKNVNAIFADLDSDGDGLLSVRELQQALGECRISIAPDTLGRLMEREGALDARGMVSAKSFAELLMAGEDARPLEVEAWMQDVQHFSAANSFKQLAMLVVAQHMQPGEVEGLRQLFQALDEDATGTISAQQLGAALAHMGEQVGERELRQLLQALDLRRDGVIQYDEFLAACLESRHLTEGRLRAAYSFFDRQGRGGITQGDVAQVLQDVGMDASAAEHLMAAAASSAGATPGGSPKGGSANGSPRSPGAALLAASRGGPASPRPAASGAAAAAAAAAAGPAGSPRPPDSPSASSRSISYADFRRLLLGPSPPSIITKALSRASSVPEEAGAASPRAGAGAGATNPRLATALESIARGGGSAASPLLRSSLSLSPGSGESGRLGTAPRSSGQSPEALSPEAQRWQQQACGLGPEPPSPISLLPRAEPPSPNPISLRLRADEPSSRMLSQRRPSSGEPLSPMLSLRPRAEPPSPCTSRSAQQASPPYRPYASLAAAIGSPGISLAPREPPSPLVGSGGLSPDDGRGGLASPTGGGTGGLTLTQILQQYSSSGWKSRGASSRRGSVDVQRSSIDTPRGRPSGEGGRSADSSMARESVLSDVDWAGGYD